MMKKAVIALLILVITGNLVFGTPTTGQDLPDWILEDFDQKVVNVGFVVNDILYAGFSSRKIDKMIPVTSNLPDVMNFNVDKGDAFCTQPFFLYCIYSTARPVTLTLNFANLEPKGGKNYQNGNHMGWMYTDDMTVPENDRKIAVEFEGGSADKWPYELEVIPKAAGHNDQTEYTKVHTGVISSPDDDLLKLRLPKTNIPKTANGTYSTVMVLTAVIY